jgi:hypothetical protein
MLVKTSHLWWITSTMSSPFQYSCWARNWCPWKEIVLHLCLWWRWWSKLFQHTVCSRYRWVFAVGCDYVHRIILITSCQKRWFGQNHIRMERHLVLEERTQPAIGKTRYMFLVVVMVSVLCTTCTSLTWLIPLDWHGLNSKLLDLNLFLEDIIPAISLEINILYMVEVMAMNVLAMSIFSTFVSNKT